MRACCLVLALAGCDGSGSIIVADDGTTGDTDRPVAERPAYDIPGTEVVSTRTWHCASSFDAKELRQGASYFPWVEGMLDPLGGVEPVWLEAPNGDDLEITSIRRDELNEKLPIRFEPYDCRPGGTVVAYTLVWTEE
jgi:hypothetical protein